jgi:hypothetical protein
VHHVGWNEPEVIDLRSSRPSAQASSIIGPAQCTGTHGCGCFAARLRISCSARHGERYLRERLARTELARVNRELK